VGDAFQRVTNAMREVIHWVDTPVITSFVMARMNNPIDYRVSKVDIWRAHINFEPHDMLSFFELAASHPFK
jgi:hypothetical protein